MLRKFFGISNSVALVAFLLPFMSVSCNGMKIMSWSGYQTALGLDPSLAGGPGGGGGDSEGMLNQASEDESKPLFMVASLVALLAALAGLVFVGLNKNLRTAAKATGAAGLVGMLLFVVLVYANQPKQPGAEDDATEQTDGEEGSLEKGLKEGVNEMTKNIKLSLNVEVGAWLALLAFGASLFAGWRVKDKPTAPGESILMEDTPSTGSEG